MKYLSFLLALSSFSCMAQNYVPDNGEIINRGDLNLNSVVSSNKWTTTRDTVAGKFSNYGPGKFTDGTATALTVTSNPAKWIDGYVKHYATASNTSHVYPVGSTTERLFVSTSGEIVGNALAIAWIPGAYNITSKDPDIISVSSSGRWRWITSLEYTGLITATVKIPGSITAGSNLRLIGWNGVKWVILANNAYSSANRTLTGTIPKKITALSIGSTTVAISKNQQSTVSAMNTNTEFVIYPNPAGQNDSFVLDFNITYRGIAKIIISDLNGKKVHTAALNISDTRNIHTIDKAIHSGIYNVAIYNESETILFANQKLVIK